MNRLQGATNRWCPAMSRWRWAGSAWWRAETQDEGTAGGSRLSGLAPLFAFFVAVSAMGGGLTWASGGESTLGAATSNAPLKATVRGGGMPRAVASGLSAQEAVESGPPYNGQFTYVRIAYEDATANLRSMRFGRRGRRGWGMVPHWAHDWPRAEVNFAKILDATTFIDTYKEGNAGRVLTLDDPELFNYPVATIIEVGYWQPSDSEVRALREYLLKGGFLIVDDTREERGFEFENLQRQMQRVLPGYTIQRVPSDHEIFNSFFRIEDPLALVPPYGPRVPVYLGIFEDNDPENGRIMVMINFNTDLQEYWEFSDVGYYPIDLSNEAYKFGVNYMIYSFTH